jgi:hypothetical protein
MDVATRIEELRRQKAALARELADMDARSNCDSWSTVSQPSYQSALSAIPTPTPTSYGTSSPTASSSSAAVVTSSSVSYQSQLTCSTPLRSQPTNAALASFAEHSSGSPPYEATFVKVPSPIRHATSTYLGNVVGVSHESVENLRREIEDLRAREESLFVQPPRASMLHSSWLDSLDSLTTSSSSTLDRMSYAGNASVRSRSLSNSPSKLETFGTSLTSTEFESDIVPTDVHGRIAYFRDRKARLARELQQQQGSENTHTIA